MLAVIAAVLIMFAFVTFAAGVVSPSVALSGSDKMEKTGTGTVRETVPFLIPPADGEWGAGSAWLSYKVDMEIDGEPEELMAWAPDWYGAREEGSELVITYDPENPSTCMIAEVREAFEEIAPICLRASVATAAVGTVLAVISVVTGF